MTSDDRTDGAKFPLVDVVVAVIVVVVVVVDDDGGDGQSLPMLEHVCAKSASGL